VNHALRLGGTLTGAPSNFLLNRESKRLYLVSKKPVDNEAREQTMSPLQTHNISLLKKRSLYVPNILYWNLDLLEGSVEHQSLPIFERHGIGKCGNPIARQETQNTDNKD
jgi:hypothetical protein